MEAYKSNLCLLTDSPTESPTDSLTYSLTD